MSVSSFARASITCAREGQGQGEKRVKKEGAREVLIGATASSEESCTPTHTSLESLAAILTLHVHTLGLTWNAVLTTLGVQLIQPHKCSY